MCLMVGCLRSLAAVSGSPGHSVVHTAWFRKGVWLRIMASLAADADLEHLMVDGSIVRVHQHGAAKNRSGRRSHGQIPRGTEHQDLRSRRCHGQSGASATDAWSSLEIQTSRSADRGFYPRGGIG